MLPPGAPPLVVVAKGVEADSLKLPLEVVADPWPGLAAVVLSGPNFAHEVAGGADVAVPELRFTNF